MGPQQARQKGQQHDYYANNLSMGNTSYNRHVETPSSVEHGFGFDTSGMIYQQNNFMNGRPILPYPDTNPMPGTAMYDAHSYTTPPDFAVLQQYQWQLHHAAGTYYPPPTSSLPFSEPSLVYPVPPMTHQDRSRAVMQPDVTSYGGSSYRPIAPAPAHPMPHHIANVAASPHWQQPTSGDPYSAAAAAEEAVDLVDHMRVSSGSSVFPSEVVYENGRTYQAYREDAYYLPNDPQEQDRLDFTHCIHRILMDGRLYLAPLRQPRNVLDLGTGTGVWASEFAKEHPDAEVTGTDLTLIQPTHKPLPPNVSFIKEDAEEDEWSIPLGFDYIHVRELYMAIKDHMKFLRNIYKHLAPGGWIEVQDVRVEFLSDDGTSEGSALERHCQLFGRGLTLLGRDITALGRYRAMLAEVGFVEASICEHVIPLPCSNWPSRANYRRAGLYQALNIHEVVESVTYKVLQVAGLSGRDMKKMAAEVRSEVVSKRVHGYWPVHIIYAQKPW